MLLCTFTPTDLFRVTCVCVIVKEDTLTDMMLHMTEKVGLVHQLPNMMDGNLQFSRVVEKVWGYILLYMYYGKYIIDTASQLVLVIFLYYPHKHVYQFTTYAYYTITIAPPFGLGCNTLRFYASRSAAHLT